MFKRLGITVLVGWLVVAAIGLPGGYAADPAILLPLLLLALVVIIPPVMLTSVVTNGFSMADDHRAVMIVGGVIGLMWVGLLYVGALGLGYVAPDPIPSPLQAALGLGLVAAGLATISTLVVRDGDHQPS